MLLRSKNSFFILVLLLTMLFSVNLAWAQEGTIQIQKLETQILPEYDTTDILVINTIEFKNTSKQDFSGELKWRVPKGSKSHILLDNKNPNKHLQKTVNSEENFDLVTWKLPDPIKPGTVTSVHLEYYYNNLQGSPNKTFSFEFIPDYPVSTAEVYVIQPIKATNFKLTPDFGPGHQSDKFTFFVKNFFISPENGIKIDASYTKSDPSPSLSSQQTQSGTEQGQDSGQGLAGFLSGNMAKYLLGGGIGAFILFLIYRELRNRNTKEYDVDDEDFEEDEEDDDKDLTYRRNRKQEASSENKSYNEKSSASEEDDYNDEDNRTEEETEELGSSLSLEMQKLEAAFKDGRISESDYLEMLTELEEEEAK